MLRFTLFSTNYFMDILYRVWALVTAILVNVIFFKTIHTGHVMSKAAW